MEKMNAFHVEFSETVMLEARIWQKTTSRSFPGGSWLLTSIKSQIRSVDENKKHAI